MEMTATVASSAGTLRMRGSGDFQNDPVLGQFTATVVSGARQGSMQEVMSGSRIYLSSDAIAGSLPGGKTWMSLDLSKAFDKLGIDLGSFAAQSPTDALARLKASGEVTEDGVATIDGVATTHYIATIDPAKAADLSKKLHVTVTYQPVEVWVDEQGLVRRVQMTFAQSSATAPAVSTQMTIDLTSYGEAVHVDVPGDDVTFDATTLATNAIQSAGP